jgi:hypothetical protein
MFNRLVMGFPGEENQTLVQSSAANQRVASNPAPAVELTGQRHATGQLPYVPRVIFL